LKHAVADAPTRFNWKEDLFGLKYVSPRTAEVELSINNQAYEPFETAAQTLIKRLHPQAQIVLDVIARALIDAGGEINVEIDVTKAAGRAYGLDSIDSEQKAKASRAQVWNDAEFLSRISIRSRRKGKYRVQGRNRDVIEISTDESLFRISEYAVLASDPGDRVRMIIEPRGLIKAYAKNKSILQEFGSLNITTNIQPGKPSGMLARSIHDTLVQHWREGASHYQIGDNGDGHREVIRYKPFTRRELLLSPRAYRSAFNVEECLAGKDAKRIIKYWESAIKKLQKDGAIGYYSEKGDIDLKSRDWRSQWLDQSIDIRPTGNDASDAVKIAKQAAKNRKAHEKSKARQEARLTAKKMRSNES
jgi:hypothetical protein